MLIQHLLPVAVAVAMLASGLLQPRTITIESDSRKATLGVSETTKADKTQVENYIRKTAREYGLDEYIFTEVARCESAFRVDAIGDNGLAYGVFQFHENTFNMFKNKFVIPEFEYRDWQDQTHLAAMMWKKGLASNHWTCWLKTVRLN